MSDNWNEAMSPYGQTTEYVVILGMHRSGTSFLGNVIHDLGYSIGRSPMTGDAANPEGYYENLAIVQLHDELLERASSSWCDLHAIPPEWWTPEIHEEFGSRLRQALDEEFAGQPRRVVKDPRLCRLWPLWHHHFADANSGEVRILLPVRSPWEVAQSLKKRDGFSIPYGLFLWVQHVLAAERHTRGCPRLVTTYPDLMNGTKGPDLARFLDRPEDEIAACLSHVSNPAHYHQRNVQADEGEASPIFELAAQIWTVFSSPAGGESIDPAGVDSLWRAYCDLERIVPPDFDGRHIGYRHRTTVALSAAESARQEAESARQEAESARQEAETARQEAESTRQEAESARQEADSARQEADSARQDADFARKEADLANQSLATAEAEAAQLRQRLCIDSRARAELEADLRQGEAKIVSLQNGIFAAVRAQNVLRNQLTEMAAGHALKKRALRTQLSQQRKQLESLKKTIASAEAWQRIWYKRFFHRWRPPGLAPARTGPLRRLKQSLRKRRKGAIAALKRIRTNGRTPH